MDEDRLREIEERRRSAWKRWVRTKDQTEPIDEAFGAIFDDERDLIAEVRRLRHARDEALKTALEDGQVDGDHHKMWVIDQMVRSLTHCPEEEAVALDYRGEPYAYARLGESPEYERFVRRAKSGEDGPETYGWDTGVVP